jgi:hypothetical protein
VSGTAAQVSAALGTALETVRPPGHADSIVNTTAPTIPSSLAGQVTGVVGLDGLVQEHSMLRPHPAAGNPSPAAPAPPAPAPATPTPSTSTPSGGGAAQSHISANVTPPQACSAASAATGLFPGTFTSTQLAHVYTLDQLFSQGRTGLGQTIAIVEFEPYLLSDVSAFQACYGLSNPIRNVSVDGGAVGPPQGSGEAAIDTELAAVTAPSASLVVYEAPNLTDSQGIDLYNQIASDDAAQVVTTSWGDCEALVPAGDIQTENTIFQRMAVQGQTVIAASGDSGSEDCFGANGATALGVDDPGSQPDVVSAGGTSMPAASASSQVVWNNCQGQPIQCAQLSLVGAGGGGFSATWPRNPGQPTASGSNTNPCGLGASGCRAVPDIAYAADPVKGGVIAFFSGGWVAFGGTSVGPPSNAGFFADANQGCFNRLGRVGPALYSAARGTNFTDITLGNNDFTGSHGGAFSAGPGYDPASGLGSPVYQNLVLALQGSDGCPAVASLSPSSGPTTGGGAVTIAGRGFANATTVNFGAAGVGKIVSETENSITVLPPNAPNPLCVDVTVTNPLGISATSPADLYGFGGATSCAQNGYRFVASDGGVFDFGVAPFFGSMGGKPLNRPIVGMAPTSDDSGYWLDASDGGIFTFGDAGFHGSMGGTPLNAPVVGMAATPDGDGYWLVASDGGIFTFGDAGFHGSMGGTPLNRPIVGMAATRDGGGYWLVASDGGVFSFGDAGFHGSTGALTLNSPIVGMAATPSGGGYWMVAADGGIFTFGDGQFFGSMGGKPLNKPVVGMAATPDGGGYWLVASDGGIFTFGDARFFGSTGNIRLNSPIVGMSGL